MAIDPSKSTPEDVATVSSLQSMTEESAKAAMRAPVDQAWGNARGSLIGNILGGIASAIAGVFTPGSMFSPIGQAMEPIHQGQESLNKRTDLLENVPGYVCAYMGNNVNASWDLLGNAERQMPFNKQIGPAQNGRVTSNGRVYLDAEGLWTLYVRVHARSTGYAGNGGIRMTVRVRNPNGSLHHETITYGTTLIDAGALTAGKGRGTISATFPVVIQHPGSYVEVHAWTATWRWWDGGMRYSTLAALRHSEDVINVGEDTVPDETR